MASTTELSILVRVKDEATSAFKKISGNLEGLGTAMAAVGGTIVAGLGAAVKAATDAEATQNRFETVLKNVAGATDDQVAALRRQQDALQATTRFEGEAIASAQGFLGTFALTSDQIGTLTPKILDLAEGMRTVEGGTVSLEQASNMLGKAIANGSLAALAKVGVTIPGTTKAEKDLFMQTFELANQQERVAMTAKLLDGNFKGLAEAAGTTLAGKIEIVKNTFGDLMENIGNVLIPILSNLLTQLTPIITSVSEWMAKNPELTQTIIMIAAVLGPLLVILPALVVAIGALMSPITLVIAGIALLVAAGVYLYTHWNEVKAKAQEIWGAIGAFFKSKFDEMMAVLQAVADFFVSIWDGIVAAFKIAVALFLGVLDGLLSIFDKNWKEHLSQALAYFKLIWEGMKVAFEFFVTNILPQIVTFLTTLVANITEFTEPIVNAFTTIWNTVKDVTTTIFEGIKAVVFGAVNWIIDKVNSVISAINSVASAGAAIGGFSAPQIPTIPRLADGGIVNRPTLALIGEAGPEAVVPLNKANGFGGGGGVGLTINIGTFVGGNPDAAAREIGDLIIKRLQLNARVG